MAMLIIISLVTGDMIKIRFAENSQERMLVPKYLLDKFSRTWREASVYFQIAHVTSDLGPKIYEVNWYAVMWKANDPSHRMKQWVLTRVFVKWMLTGLVYCQPGTVTREDLIYAPFGCPEFINAVCTPSHLPFTYSTLEDEANPFFSQRSSHFHDCVR